MDLQVYANLSTHNKQELTTRLQSQDILPSNSNASTSGGGRHENQLQTVNEFAMPVPRPSHRNDPGLVSGGRFNKVRPAQHEFKALAERRTLPPHRKDSPGEAATIYTPMRDLIVGNNMRAGFQLRLV